MYIAEKPQLSYDPRWLNEPLIAESYQQFIDLSSRPEATVPGLQLVQARIARAALTMYRGAETIDDFNSQLDIELEPHLGSGQLTLLSHEGIVLPMEALDTTRKNIAIAAEYGGAVEGLNEGVLMSGSNAWGSFYATRGNCKKPSDVDLVVQTDSLDSMAAIVELYIERGMIDERELRRFDLFDKYHAEGKVDMYSLRTESANTEVSMHFVLSGIMNNLRDIKAARSAPMVDGVEISVIKDFRPNTSSNSKVTKGYEIFLLDRMQKIQFVPENNRARNSKGEYLGYIAESPVGGIINVGDESSYGMGILPFFVGVSPAIVSDPGGTLRETIKAFQLNVAAASDRPTINVPRLERMPDHTSQQVKKDLSLSLRHAA